MTAERLDNSAEDSEQIGRQCEGRSPLAWARRAVQLPDSQLRPRLPARHGWAPRARRDTLRACVDYLSRATVDACEERRDQAERRKSELFHKLLRPLNITKVSSLQASTETPSKLFL